MEEPEVVFGVGVVCVVAVGDSYWWTYDVERARLIETPIPVPQKSFLAPPL